MGAPRRGPEHDGDLQQSDLPGRNGLQDLLARVPPGDEDIRVVAFTVDDVERHPVVRSVLRMYGEG